MKKSSSLFFGKIVKIFSKKSLQERVKKSSELKEKIIHEVNEIKEIEREISLRIKTLEDIDKRLERVIEKRKVFLDPNLSLTKLSMIVGSNRTYMSNVMAKRDGFRNYINNLRLEYFCKIMEEEKGTLPETLEEGEKPMLTSREITHLALKSGFSDLRTFKRVVAKSKTIWANKIKQRIYLSLQEPEAEQKQQLYRKG